MQPLTLDSMRPPQLILASASPRRADLLRVLGLRFEVVASDAPEWEDESLTAWEVAQLNAYRKARVVAKRFPDRWVLGSDTVVCLGTQLLGKPVDVEQAESMLSRLQGRAHEVVTGVCLLRQRGHQQRLFAETTRVTFLPLSAAAIHSYVARVPCLDKAGAYAIQDQGGLIISSIEGSFSNVVGLPLEALSNALRSVGLWDGSEVVE